MVSWAATANVSPSGWKRTTFVLPDGVTAVMLTGVASAPAGTVKLCAPTTITPPSGPIVWVTESYGRDVQLSTFQLLRPPSRSLTGRGTPRDDALSRPRTSLGQVPQLDVSPAMASRTPNGNSTRHDRVAFMNRAPRGPTAPVRDTSTIETSIC